MHQVVDKFTASWLETHTTWLKLFKGPILVIQYTQLVREFRGVVRRVLQYLEWEVTEAQLECVECHKEGLFHMNATTRPVFMDEKQITKMKGHIDDLYQALEARRKRGYPLYFYSNTPLIKART